MDRRTWLQLITILAAAREAHPQQRGGATTPPAEGAGRGGRGQGGLQNLPMRVTKEQETSVQPGQKPVKPQASGKWAQLYMARLAEMRTHASSSRMPNST